MRKLATIRKIKELRPIKGADRIEIAVIDGWECIVKKGEFKVHDLCVYFEIDSFLPKDDTYSFLGKTKTFEGKEGYRIRTMKMRGALSQGLALPLETFSIKNAYVGLDVTKELNVVKYDLEKTMNNGNLTSNTKKKDSRFPWFIPKTDQDRIQNKTETFFKQFKDSMFEVTLKLDGSSCTMYKIKRDLTIIDRIKRFFGIRIKESHFGVCSRNLELPKGDSYTTTFDNNGTPSEYSTSNFWKVADVYKIEDKLPEGYAIQGELIGPKIQGNYEKVSELEYYVFDVYDISNQKYLTPTQRQEFCSKYNIPHVPIVVRLEQTLHKTQQEIIQSATGPGMNPGVKREGLVFKSHDGKVSFKAISNEYLLKEK